MLSGFFAGVDGALFIWLGAFFSTGLEAAGFFSLAVAGAGFGLAADDFTEGTADAALGFAFCMGAGLVVAFWGLPVTGFFVGLLVTLAGSRSIVTGFLGFFDDRCVGLLFVEPFECEPLLSEAI